jgi:Predicted transcriptional regulators
MTMTPQLLEEAARRFALLGDPTRLRILHVLMDGGERSVGAIADAAGVTRFNASAHLNRLADAGLVSRRRDGTTVFYRLGDASLPQICETMCASLRAQARSLLWPVVDDPGGQRGNRTPTAKRG